MPERRNYLPPVAWLGGRDLLANLKLFLLFAAYKGKLDPRDWMQARTFPPKTGEREANYFDPFILNPKYQVRDEGKGKKEVVDGEFWFDYFADSGDGMTAGYAIAYLCMSDLHANFPSNWDKLLPAVRRKSLDTDAPLAEIRSHLAAGHEPSIISKDYPKNYSHLKIKNILARLRDPEKLNELITEIEKQAVGVVSVTTSKNPAPADSVDSVKLPRGAFLFLGGDTAYHVADYAGLGLRFQKVFDWAFKDLKNKGLTEEEVKDLWKETNRRPLFAVPGNHDYYDMLDGFNRQFARAITRETRFINLTERNMTPQLRLWPFKRFQTASYVALKLPFDWWLWGIDSELKRVDLRQQEFFKRSYAMSLENEELAALNAEIAANLEKELGRPPTPEEIEWRFPRIHQTDVGNIWRFPQKLIVATSAPPTVEGRRGRKEEKTPKAFAFLGLRQPFLYLEDSRGPAREEARKQHREKAEEIRKNEERLQLPDFQCRLDISGDVHHYARYWGDDSLGGEAAMAANYASVVAGGGGASMSPTQTDYDEVLEQSLYPGKEVSTRVINKGLFDPWVVISGGSIYVVGAVIAFLIMWGTSYTESHITLTNFVLNRLPFVSIPHSTNNLPSAETVGHVIKLSLLLLLSMLAILGAGGYARWLFERLTKTHEWAQNKLLNLQLAKNHDRTKEQLYKHLLEDIEAQKNAGVPDRDLASFFIISLLALLATGSLWVMELFPSFAPSTWWYWLLSLAVFLLAALPIVVIYLHSKKRFDDFMKASMITGESDETQATRVRQFTVTPYHDYLPFWALLITGVSNFILVIWVYKAEMYGPLPLFGHSTLILFSVFVAGAAAMVSMYYSKWLFEQSYSVKVTWFSYIPATVLSAIAVSLFGVAIWYFANQEARYILSDNLFLLALLALPIGCIALALAMGNHVGTLTRQAVFFVMGAWHGFLQLVVPFLLIWIGDERALLAAFVSVVVVAAIATTVMTQLRLEQLKFVINRGMVPLLWVLYGLWMIAIPFIWQGTFPEPPVMPGRLALIAVCVLASIIGALMSCVWLGWYFAVALVFQGHTNEAGSTARTEDYKHFIRFRLTNETLTGFVIGIDFPHAPQEGEVRKDGSTLKPRLIDVFTLRCPPKQT